MALKPFFIKRLRLPQPLFSLVCPYGIHLFYRWPFLYLYATLAMITRVCPPLCLIYSPTLQN